MDLRNTQLKDTYGNLVTTGTTEGSPTTGGLQNGDGQLLTAVGIGTDSPSSFFVGGNNLVVGENSSDNGITIFTGTSNTGYLLFSNGTSGNEQYKGQVRYNNSTDQLQFLTAGNLNPRLTIDSSGQVGIGTTSPDAIIETSAGVNGNTVGALLTNTNGAGTADSVSLNFGLGRSADSAIFKIEAIKLLKEQQWTGTPSTINGSLVFSTISNETTAERMRIDSSGNVQIGSGTSANAYGKLQVNQSSNTDEGGIGILSSGAGRSLRLYVDETNSYINSGNGGSGILVFNEGGGQVGIGTNSPRVTEFVIGLTIGNSTSGGSELVLRENTGNDWRIFNNGYLAFIDDNTERMRIDSSGRVGIGTDDPQGTLEVVGELYGKSYAQTSTDGTTSIVDTGLTPEMGIYEVFVIGNANSSGSGSYRSVVHGYLYVTCDFISSQVRTEVTWNSIGGEGGGSSDISLTVTPKIFSGGTEYDNVAKTTADAGEIRIKVSGYDASAVIGSSQAVRILKRV